MSPKAWSALSHFECQLGESVSLQAAAGKFLAEADATECLKESQKASFKDALQDRLTRAEMRSLEDAPMTEHRSRAKREGERNWMELDNIENIEKI